MSIGFGGGGGGGSSSSSQNSTNRLLWPRKFLNRLYEDFPSPVFENDLDAPYVENLPQSQDKAGLRGLAGQRQRLHIGIPKFRGETNFDEYEKSLYGAQADKLRENYETEVGRQNEEYSQAGLLNSPVRFSEGSGRSGLTRAYLDSLQQAAYGARTGRTEFEAAEQGRHNDFDMNLAAALEDIFRSRADIAIGAAGSRSKGKSKVRAG